jgi:uroporphyrin-III C-methyltransferase
VARRGAPARVAVAAGRAFTFGYAEHDELLAAAGAEVVPLDPLAAERPPEGTDALVVGGGFPQVHLERLAANTTLRRDVRERARAGMPVVAECAGLLWLGASLDGRDQCGVLPARARMTGTLHLGYREATALADTPLAPAGTRVRAHEFHRTVSDPARGDHPAWELADGSRRGWATPNLLASYLHLHWAGVPGAASRLVGSALAAVNVRLPRPPAWLRARLEAALAGLAAYPRPEAAVAARHGRDPAQVLLTNGAAEAFTLVARGLRPRRAVCVHPSFTAPEAALRAAGRPVGQVLLPPPFELDPGLVPADADLVVLGNPTNPTARLHPVDALEGLARPGRVLVVDEAFADAVPGEPASLAGRSDIPGLVVLRSLTKTWGLAGLRVGYLLGQPELVAALARAQPPWPVSSLALEALVACCQPAAVAWADQRARRAAGWRAGLAAALEELPGVAVTPDGQAPFLLLRIPDAAQVRARLAGLGIVVRRGDTFPGLGPDWLRMTVVAPEHHDRIVDALSRSLADGRPTAAPPARLGAPARPGGGRVTLVGAGPGGADLITLRGWQALHAADVVVTDRLADPELTAQLRPGVLVVDAGKSPGAHQLSQDEIVQTMLAHARRGRHVVRLKGGDPFVFGRGGEEVLACARAGVRSSVVPGLSSVTAAPTLAGVPVTHRGLGQSFTVVSGHLPPGHPDSTVDWPALARSTETLVLLMAVGNLERIAAFLLDGGRRPGTPVACIQHAGTSRQQVASCSLGELAGPAAAPRVDSPAVVVIGPTVAVLPDGGRAGPNRRLG